MISRTGVLALPGVRALDRIGFGRLIRVLSSIYVVALVGVVLLREPVNPLASGRDPINYLAAGERLNAGHPLYELSPGDRLVPIEPPYWTSPLLSPPPIAVLWRPLALIGEPAALAWWLVGLLGCIAVGGWVLVRGSPAACLALVALTPPLALTALSGNANAWLIPLLFVAWSQRDRAWVVGSIMAVAAMVKVTPVLLLVWLVASRRWQAVAATLVVTAVLALLGALGAGATSWPDWLAGVAKGAPYPISVAGLTGLPSVSVAVLIGSMTVVAAIAAGRESMKFRAAIIGSALATPAFYFAPLALLVGGLATAAASKHRPN